VELGTYRTSAEAFDRAVVVLALGRDCWLVPEGERHRLLVESGAFEAMREQLARYERESARWPPAPLHPVSIGQKIDWHSPLYWAALVLTVFWAQGQWPQITALGALDAAAFVDRAEWWRALTALFLHANPDHILANLFTGIFIFPAALSNGGRVRGWTSLILASVLANAAIAVLSYPGPYRSIGASTAIFAALGLLTGHAIRRVAASRHPHRWRAMFVPLTAGLTVLALYGAGGQNVDVGAHAVGFVTGLVLALARRNVGQIDPV
jgi:membrane associated rhomboid family serine protease